MRTRSERSSALWGTGRRGGDRSSALWGKGGRGILVSCCRGVRAGSPIAACEPADSGEGPARTRAQLRPASIAPSRPKATGKVDVDHPVLEGRTDAASKAKASRNVSRRTCKQLDLVGGRRARSCRPVASEKLAKVSGPRRHAERRRKSSGASELEPAVAATGPATPALARRRDALQTRKLPTIAIVDSGIDRTAPTSATRGCSRPSTSRASRATTRSGDGRGHGTFVAGIAAGAAPTRPAPLPERTLVSLDVMNDQGLATSPTSSRPASGSSTTRRKYNIRVANFSLHSTLEHELLRDPLDQAVEKLWFNGVVVVAAAGQLRHRGRPERRALRPGQRPVRDHGRRGRPRQQLGRTTTRSLPGRHTATRRTASRSRSVAAPGRYMVGPVPPGSTLRSPKASNLVGTDTIQLSGTSFAAPVVAGTVSQMLARHPGWTPDQVKGVLMRTARAVRRNPKAAGVGEITASRAAAATYAPNPNVGLEQFFKSVSGGPGQAFDAMSWANAAKSDMSWNSMSWTSQSWSDQSWSDQSWASMSWADMSWNSMSWTDMSWADMSWADMSSEDAAEGDGIDGAAGYEADPQTSRRLRPIRRSPSPWTGSTRWRRSASRRPRLRPRPRRGCGPGRDRGGQHRQLAPAVRHEHTPRRGPAPAGLRRGPHPDGGSVRRAPEWGMGGSPPQP